METIFQDNEHVMQEWELFKIEKMKFTLDTLESSLQTIANRRFLPGEGYESHHVTALFLYCMKIDEYFKKNHANYKTDLLVDILVNILIKVDYIIPQSSYCSIL